jgi:hypothetical protein
MAEWSKSGLLVPGTGAHGAYAISGGAFWLRGDAASVAHLAAESPDGNAGRTDFRATSKSSRDMASPLAGVMLHLRFCYVSKAAILTVPVSLVPVGNRSPA